MAKAPNILLFLLLTSIITDATSCIVFCETCAMLTFLAWTHERFKQLAIKAERVDKSKRQFFWHIKQRRKLHQRYHLFKQRMKYKHANKGHYRKPSPLFHLTWKFKMIKLTIFAIVAISLAGCCVKRLVDNFFQGLWSLLVLGPHRVCLAFKLH